MYFVTFTEKPFIVKLICSVSNSSPRLMFKGNAGSGDEIGLRTLAPIVTAHPFCAQNS